MLLIRRYLGAAEYICTQKDPTWLLKLHNNFLICHSIESILLLGLALVWAQADVCQFLNPNAILRFVLSKAELVRLVIEKKLRFA